MAKRKKRKQLRKKQLDVINDLFESGLDESAVLAKHNVSMLIYRKWLADEPFASELSFRIESAKRQSELVIAKYAHLAAVKLVQLTESEKEETARKACLDIISLPFSKKKGAVKEQSKQDEQDSEQIPQETASRLLAALANEKG